MNSFTTSRPLIWPSVFIHSRNTLINGFQRFSLNHRFLQTVESLQVGVAALGSRIVEGVDAIADAVTSLGGILPELFFSEDQDGDNDQHDVSAHVVVTDSRAKRRTTPLQGNGVKTSAVAVKELPRVQNVEDDWTKED